MSAAASRDLVSPTETRGTAALVASVMSGLRYPTWRLRLGFADV
jgi:hypothetical protein